MINDNDSDDNNTDDYVKQNFVLHVYVYEESSTCFYIRIPKKSDLYLNSKIESQIIATREAILVINTDIKMMVFGLKTAQSVIFS